MWRKLTDPRYRVLVMHMLTVGAVFGLWASIICLPVNQIVFS